MDSIEIPNDHRLALRAAVISVVMSLVLLAIKFWAYHLTHSQAVFSDAMETIANVVAAILAALVLRVAYKPADRDHPYGHGKVEFFSAAFEGGMIAFASIIIFIGAIQSFVRGAEPGNLLQGLAIIVAAGLINALLGIYLLRVGRQQQSAALEASGRHVLSDFWTSAGVLIGIGLVQLTGLKWIDPLCAILVGLYLGYTGLKLFWKSASGLLDAEDRGLLDKLVYLFGRERPAGIIQIHHMRVMRSGSYHHIDAHAVMPEYWNVAEAHAEVEKFEARMMAAYPYSGELDLHVDPCRQAYCRECDVQECPIRVLTFEHRRYLSLDEITNPEEPSQFRKPGTS